MASVLLTRSFPLRGIECFFPLTLFCIHCRVTSAFFPLPSHWLRSSGFGKACFPALSSFFLPLCQSAGQIRGGSSMKARSQLGFLPQVYNLLCTPSFLNLFSQFLYRYPVYLSSPSFGSLSRLHGPSLPVSISLFMLPLFFLADCQKSSSLFPFASSHAFP